MGVMAKYADKHCWYMLIHPKSSFKSDQQTISTISNWTLGKSLSDHHNYNFIVCTLIKEIQPCFWEKIFEANME